ncbi:hypothetical protein ACFOSC_00880 [Streptantibioticus rubrisoli]|uniref:Uncharacterized protein n=1 Tax=Streptantibioticus rubrisoli TaxID=1387313 RepID=A0ABT1PD60_9ACTN|nr:hypothetical protein [Streptantibioticus rubrisoli]MCQ4043315.1 hypothetical protein [Streptantibioticus rubrisoli]
MPVPTVTVTRSAPVSMSPSPMVASATSSASPTAAVPAATTPAPPLAPRPHLTNASAVVSQYYQDITDHNYAAAWALGGSNIAGTTYDRWVAGFGTTESITLGSVSGFGSSQVQAALYATQTDGTVKVYDGTYVVSDGVLVGASIRQVN